MNNFIVMSEHDVKTSTIIEFIQKHMIKCEELDKKYEYFLGKTQILERTMKDPTKPNVKLVSGFPSYICNISTSYFLGKPIVYKGENATLAILNKVHEKNDEHHINRELALKSSIYGNSYELLYMGIDGDIKQKVVSPRETFLIVDNSLEENIIMGIRYFTIDEYNNYQVEIYDNSTISTYILDNALNLKFIRSVEHYFGQVPIVEYKNNEEEMGDFDRVITLIDEYEKLQSDTANDFEYFSDAYLTLTNAQGTDPEDILRMKEQRVMLLPEGGEAAWLTKNIQDTAMENYKNRIVEDIHKFSMVPPMTDENFSGNASGVAMRYKLLGLEQLTGIKERWFKKSIMKRVNLISNFLRVVHNVTLDIESINLQFTRNIPINEKEVAELVVMLKDIISQQTQLSLLTFIDNAEKEMNLMTCSHATEDTQS